MRTSLGRFSLLHDDHRLRRYSIEIVDEKRYSYEIIL